MKITRYFVTCREENQRIYILEVGWDGNLPHIYFFFEKVSYRNHLNIHPCPTSIYFKILNKMLNKSKKKLISRCQLLWKFQATQMWCSYYLCFSKPFFLTNLLHLKFYQLQQPLLLVLRDRCHSLWWSSYNKEYY